MMLGHDSVTRGGASSSLHFTGALGTSNQGDFYNSVLFKGRSCLELLGNLTEASIDLQKKSVRDAFGKEQAEERCKSLEQRIASMELERKPELKRIFALASEFQRAKEESMLRKQVEEKVESLKLELESARAETDRIKERYREAVVSSTKNAMQVSQLSEELESAKQAVAKAERNAIKEARKATQITEEKATLAKRCEQLEKQLTQLRNQYSTQSTVRVRPLDDFPSSRGRQSSDSRAPSGARGGRGQKVTRTASAGYSVGDRQQAGGKKFKLSPSIGKIFESDEEEGQHDAAARYDPPTETRFSEFDFH